jgi:KaiC/GvpD/RAD55 family RecA-like ATPase
MKPLTSLSAEEREKLSLLSLDDLAALPDPVYLIDGVLPANVLGVLYGAPGAGKSFIALDMASAIASGREWLGRETRPGKVLYVAAEGALGMKRRIAAYQTRHSIPGDNIRFLPVPFDARSSKSSDAVVAVLAENGFKPDLIIVDTLARVAVGADENSAKDMGQVVEGFEMLRRNSGATILVIHHTTKNGNHVRGSSALEGASDVMIECDKAEDAKGTAAAKLTCTKMKDDEPFPEMGICLEKVELPNGKSSLLVQGSAKVFSKKGSGKADRKTELSICEILQTQFDEKGARHKDLKAAFLKKEGKSKESAFDRALRSLKDRGDIVKNDVEGHEHYTYPAGRITEQGKSELRQQFADFKSEQKIDKQQALN